MSRGSGNGSTSESIWIPSLQYTYVCIIWICNLNVYFRISEHIHYKHILRIPKYIIWMCIMFRIVPKHFTYDIQRHWQLQFNMSSLSNQPNTTCWNALTTWRKNCNDAWVWAESLVTFNHPWCRIESRLPGFKEGRCQITDEGVRTTRTAAAMATTTATGAKSLAHFYLRGHSKA